MVLEPTEHALGERGAMLLEGPLLDLSVRGDRAVVSMGSMGVAILDISEAQPVVIQTIQPECVVASADISGDALAVGCMSGALLYDLRGDEPRLAGFHPSKWVIIDVRFFGDQLIVNDWLDAVLFDVNLDGEVV